MQYLYASKRGGIRKLVATFGSEAQLLSYVRWATLEDFGAQRGKFEQGSALAGYEAWEHSPNPAEGDEDADVLFNPTPNMM